MFKSSMTLLLLLLSAPTLAEKVYKWVDEDGQIHYSSKQPVDQQAETVELKKAPKAKPEKAAEAESAATDPAATANQEAEAMTAEEAEADAAAKKALAAADRVNRKKQCVLAKQNLAALNATVRVSKTDENGEIVRLTDAQRLSAMKSAQTGVKEYCN